MTAFDEIVKANYDSTEPADTLADVLDAFEADLTAEVNRFVFIANGYTR